MSRRCALHPEHKCAPEKDGKCVCVPPGQDPAEWKAMAPQQRGRAMNDMGLLIGSLFNPRHAK